MRLLTGRDCRPQGKGRRLVGRPALIGVLPGTRDPKAFLFPKYAGSRQAHSLVTCWRTICENAQPGSLRLHDLRHTIASQAVISSEIFPCSAGCLDTNGIALRRAMRTSPTGTWSRWRRRPGASSPAPWCSTRLAVLPILGSVVGSPPGFDLELDTAHLAQPP